MNSIPPVTKNLLIINLLFFLGIFVAEKYGINLRSELGLHFFMAEDFILPTVKLMQNSMVMHVHTI